jgi:hypothetical protein
VQQLAWTGATFWGKIRENFIRRGGGPERTTNSLQNRFNKVLQCEVQKFIGFLQGALREYHSGWQMADYVLEAKKQFMFKMAKTFKHDDVYNILKCSLAKYELVFSSMDSRVARALFLLDSDANAGVVRINGLTHANSTDTVDPLVPVCDIERTSLLTPRPSIGKRKAKAIEFARQQEKKRQEGDATKTPIAIPLTNQQLMVEAAKNGRNMALNRLAAAAERKNSMAYEQIMSQYYTNHPNSAEVVTFFAAMGQRYKDKQQEQVLLCKECSKPFKQSRGVASSAWC